MGAGAKLSSLHLMTARAVTCVLIGDTGAGKSKFGNRYLGRDAFTASDSPDPVTLEPQVESVCIDGLTRYVIDTEGHADGNSISSVQIEKLALFLKSWSHGVNGICVMLNGQQDRFSQGVKDTLQWVYNTFATTESLSHICIVNTRCYAGIEEPNRERRRREFGTKVQEFLKTISGRQGVPEIPMFFVDSKDLNGMETKQNMVQFHGWLAGRNALSTKQVEAVALREKIEDEYQHHVFSQYRYDGPKDNQRRYAVYVNRKRQKITPYNGDPVRYSDWQVIGTTEQSAGHRIVRTHSRRHEREKKEVDHHSAHSWSGFSSHDHTHYEIYRKTYTEKWTETTDFDGKVSRSPSWREDETPWRLIDRDRERGWTKGYECEV
jgi:hypothetical protein